MSASPPRHTVVLVAVLGALLAVLLAWQGDVPLRPESLDGPALGIGLAATVVAVGLFYATDPGRRVVDFLSDTPVGRLVVLLAGLVLLVVFSDVDRLPAAALASAILGASVGSLARLAVS